MSPLLAVLALLATSTPAPLAVSTLVRDTSVAAIPERLLAQRARLRLSEAQVEHLRELVDKYRFQENQDRVSSKPWLRRTPSSAQARSEVLRGLSAEQQRLAASVINRKA